VPDTDLGLSALEVDGIGGRTVLAHGLDGEPTNEVGHLLRLRTAGCTIPAVPLRGTDGNDTLRGDGGNDRPSGGSGQDARAGGGGNGLIERAGGALAGVAGQGIFAAGLPRGDLNGDGGRLHHRAARRCGPFGGGPRALRPRCIA
jgi:Ca2+-binding RTX toxin-like protein